MKSLKHKLASSLALLVFLCATQMASAFYDPSLGRWLNRDPIKEEGGINLCVFAGQDPINHIDPFGLARYHRDCNGTEKAACRKTCESLGLVMGACIVEWWWRQVWRTEFSNGVEIKIIRAFVKVERAPECICVSPPPPPIDPPRCQPGNNAPPNNIIPFPSPAPPPLPPPTLIY
jgi:hypothetical protein